MLLIMSRKEKLYLTYSGSTEDSCWCHHGTQEWDLPEDSQEGLTSHEHTEH